MAYTGIAGTLRRPAALITEEVSEVETERNRLTAEVERLLESVKDLPPSQPEYKKYPYRRASVHWKSIEALTKDAGDWLSIHANKPNAFASKPWLQCQLNGDQRAARSWPIEDLVRDLSFIRTDLVTSGVVTEGQHPSRTGSRSDDGHGQPQRGARPGTTSVDTQRRKRKTDPEVQQIKEHVRKLRKGGLDYREICDRLGTAKRPPRASWRDLSWPKAYLKHKSTVTKWLSEACS
jgi:hypothetical protein